MKGATMANRRGLVEVQRACEACDGDGTVQCNSCEGSGEQPCDECDGQGQVDCSDCDGDGKLDCDKCDGDGTVECGWCHGAGCGHCDDGLRPCSKCGASGKLGCRTCKGDGSILCENCEGKGNIACEDCDDGLVECSECDGTGLVDSDGGEEDTDSYDASLQEETPMGQLVAVRQGELAAIGTNRSAIHSKFEIIGREIVETANEIQAIKDRGFFERATSNNTRDLAVAMQHIVRIQQHTLAFVTALIELHNRNIQMLEFLREQVDETRQQVSLCQTADDEQNETLESFGDTMDDLIDVIDAKIARVDDRNEYHPATSNKYPPVTSSESGGWQIAIGLVVGLALAALIIGLLLK